MRTISTLFILLTAFISLSPIGFEEALTARVEEVLERSNSHCTYEYVGDGWFEFTTPEGKTFRRQVGGFVLHKADQPDKIITIDVRTIDTTGYGTKFRKIATLPIGTGYQPAVGYDEEPGRKWIVGHRLVDGTFPNSQIYETTDGGESFYLAYDYPETFLVVPSAYGHFYDGNTPQLATDSSGSILVFDTPSNSHLPIRRTVSALRGSSNLFQPRVEDLDGDGYTELILKHTTNLVVKYDLSSNSFIDVFSDNFSNEFEWGSWAVGFFDLDARKEFATVLRNQEVVFVEYDGVSSYEESYREKVPLSSGGFNVEGDDLDLDGKQEAFIGSSGFGGPLYISVFEGFGNDLYHDSLRLVIDGVGALRRTLNTADIDGDGLDELIITYGGMLLILKASSYNHYEPFWLGYFSGEVGVRFVDLEGDGAKEILVGQITNRTGFTEILRYHSPPVSVPPSPAPGTFEVHSVYPQPAASSTTISFIPECAGRCSISLYDINGRVVYTKSFHAASAA
ncbi:MAG: hypothetical protein CL946_12455, partial [Ectothiorhodospiraceae bacterium]|nr:hypothetical protein [Ectothiorhodospiraceae bacterium]